MKAYFEFSRRQKIGVASLSVIIVFLVVVLNVNSHRGIPEPIMDVSEFNSITNAIDSNSEGSQDKKNYTLTYFDPNELNQQGWIDLGFSEKQAASIIKYKKAFGPFQSAHDLEKIYAISDEKFSEIEPYVRIEKKANDGVDTIRLKPIFINEANAEALEKLYGIGPAFASRTIKYRDLLGGFVHHEQYAEIYGISEEAIQSLSTKTVIKTDSIKRIKINSAPKKEIRSHPYLKDWAVVTEIIDQRDKKQLLNLDCLIEKELMSQDQLNKLLPYIDFDE